MRRTPKTSLSLARRYRSAHGLIRAEVWAGGHGRGRPASWHAAVAHALRGPDLRCDPYLCDATYRWLLDVVTTPDGLGVYLQRWRAWIIATDRRALHTVCAARWRHLVRYLDHLRPVLAPRTVHGYMTVIRSWYSHARSIGLIDDDLVTRRQARRYRYDDAAVEKGPGVRQALTQREAQEALAWALTAAPPAAGLAIALQLTGGLRSAEVAHLRRSYLHRDLDGPWLLTVQGKGNRTRVITLEPGAVAAWRRYAAVHGGGGTRGALIRRPGGGHYSPSSVRRWAKNALTHIGRPDLSSHDLRATNATLLIEMGARLSQVSKHLGHSAIATTDRCYVRRADPVRVTTGLTATATGHAHA